MLGAITSELNGSINLTPIETIITFWMSRLGKKEYPKTEQDTLILHESIKKEKGCWDCPNRIQCEWAEKHLRTLADKKHSKKEQVFKVEPAKTTLPETKIDSGILAPKIAQAASMTAKNDPEKDKKSI